MILLNLGRKINAEKNFDDNSSSSGLKSFQLFDRGFSKKQKRKKNQFLIIKVIGKQIVRIKRCSL